MDPVVHFEVPADDSERAQAFYKQAFGWEFTPNPELNYTLITTSPAGEDMRPGSGTINGGIAERYPEAKGAIIVIGVDSVEALMAAVQEAGGTEVMPVM